MQKVNFEVNKQALFNNFSDMCEQLSIMDNFSPSYPPLGGSKLQITLFQRQNKIHDLTTHHTQRVQLINVHAKEKEFFTRKMDMWNTSMVLFIKKRSNLCSSNLGKLHS